MITNDESNIKLTPEQITAIEYSKSVLLNLEVEISIAQKTIRQVKSESERAIKDKAYQEELLAEVTNQVSASKINLENLTAQINEMIDQLNLLREESKKLGISHQEKSTELSNREFVVSKKETELCNKEIKHNKDLNDLFIDKTDFDSKVARLKDVTSQF